MVEIKYRIVKIDLPKLMRTLLIILTTIIVLLIPWMVFTSEPLMETDAEYHELAMTLNEQELIDRVILRYEWDDVVQGTTTVRMTATVN